MRSPATKYKGLKFLMVLAFVIVVCAIVVAENGNEDSNEVSTTVATPDTNSAVNEDSNEVSATVATPDTNSAVNEDSNEVSTTATVPDTNSAVNEDSNEVSTTVATPDINSAVNEDSIEVSTTATVPDTNSAVSGDPNQQDVSATLEQQMLKTISVDFVNTPIEDVIKMIAGQANVNIIKSPTVTGNVTATLTNVPLGEALDNILAIHGYGRVIDRNMIRIAPLAEIAQKEEILDTKVYHITYADVTQVESALNKFLSKRGSISSSRGTSDIIVKDVESNIKAMDSFIEKIDRITPQVMVEVRIYDVTSTEGFDISAEWAAGRNNPITTVTTNADDIDIDNIAGTKTSTTAINKTRTTVWQESDAGLASGTESYAHRKSKPFIGGSFDATTAGTIRLGLLDAVNVDIALNVLHTQVGAKLLADPRILVLDNETAEFKIISEIPYTEASDTSSGGTLTSTKFKEVGVELKVTPHITRDGMIRLHIIPEFSVVSELGDIVAGGHTVPTVDARKADTKALVKDGQTVVIGGLRKRTVSNDVSKIPILGDIPLLGALFTEVSEEVRTNELIIFITPIIVAEPTLSPRELKCLNETEFGDPKVDYTKIEKAEKAERARK
jgi:type IV pilus assembly protein PilQ